MQPKQVLIIDDDESLRRVMELTLDEAGFQVMTAVDGEQGLVLFRDRKPAVVICDVQMPGMSGYEVLEQIRKEQPDTLVIIITAFGTIEKAVRAMKLGAFDYLTKPFSRDALRQVLNGAFSFRNLPAAKTQSVAGSEDKPTLQLIGTSPLIEDMRELISRVGPSPANVLLLGESGTGKEVVARLLHRQSPRRDKPFIAVNCAAIPSELLESELFGHRRGSFTGAHKDQPGKFALADGGTLFLDEIGELPLMLQPKLLRALQEQEITPVGGQPQRVDVRVVAATNRDLEQALDQGSFREDLYYRLAVVAVSLPPLRDRKEDINLFVEYFLNKFSNEPIQLAEGVLQALRDYDWPGNIRELENAVERMVVLRSSDLLEVADLPPKVTQARKRMPVATELLANGDIGLVELEKAAIVEALDRCHGNQTKAAALLKIPRHVLIYRMSKYGLQR